MTAIMQRSRSEAAIGAALTHGRFHGLRAATPSLVALTGSLRTAPAFDRGEQLLQQLVAALLTCGTLRRDQFDVAETLEGRGATLSVESEQRRIRFSARACTVDLPVVLELLSECLREPRFAAEDFATEQARLISELRYRATEPRALAEDALSRLLYPPQHPRHVADLAAQIAHVERLTVADVRRYHRDHFGANDLHVVAVGDIDPLETAGEVDHHLAGWSPRSRPAGSDAGGHAELAKQIEIDVPDHENFDIVLGHRLAVGSRHPDYMALWMASHILGGSFTSRLVTAVREQQGLTYSIYSMLTKPDGELEGHWQIGLSLSPDKRIAGLAAMRSEVSRFVELGVTPQELAARQREALGIFHISLATLSALAETMLFGAEQGWGPDYVHQFAAELCAVTAGQLNRAMREHLCPEDLRIVTAGPFEPRVDSPRMQLR
jgi:zinc protease